MENAEIQTWIKVRFEPTLLDLEQVLTPFFAVTESPNGGPLQNWVPGLRESVLSSDESEFSRRGFIEVIELCDERSRKLTDISAALRGEDATFHAFRRVKAFGQRFGARLGLYGDKKNKWLFGVLSGFAEKLSSGKTPNAQKVYRNSMRLGVIGTILIGAYLDGTTAGQFAVMLYSGFVYFYFFCVWIMSATTVRETIPIDWSLYSSEFKQDISLTVQSALTGSEDFEGNFQYIKSKADGFWENHRAAQAAAQAAAEAEKQRALRQWWLENEVYEDEPEFEEQNVPERSGDGFFSTIGKATVASAAIIKAGNERRARMYWECRCRGCGWEGDRKGGPTRQCPACGGRSIRNERVQG